MSSSHHTISHKMGNNSHSVLGKFRTQRPFFSARMSSDFLLLTYIFTKASLVYLSCSDICIFAISRTLHSILGTVIWKKMNWKEMSMYINIFLLVACGLQKTKICDVKMTGKSHFKKIIWNIIIFCHGNPQTLIFRSIFLGFKPPFFHGFLGSKGEYDIIQKVPVI